MYGHQVWHAMLACGPQPMAIVKAKVKPITGVVCFIFTRNQYFIESYSKPNTVLNELAKGKISHWCAVKAKKRKNTWPFKKKEKITSYKRLMLVVCFLCALCATHSQVQMTCVRPCNTCCTRTLLPKPKQFKTILSSYCGWEIKNGVTFVSIGIEPVTREKK